MDLLGFPVAALSIAATGCSRIGLAPTSGPLDWVMRTIARPAVVDAEARNVRIIPLSTSLICARPA
jgi:hypothetical protein